MDPRLSQAILRNDIPAFKKLIEGSKRILERKSTVSLDSVLHLASRFGHYELAAEIVKLHPDMVSEKNTEHETPLHEACRRGNVEVVKLLLETNPLVATELNLKNQTALSIACREGHLCVVKLLLSQSWLMEVEEGAADSTPLHIATLTGHSDIVKEILQVRPNFARKIDKNGFSALHCACSKGLFLITKLLLSLDPDLALQYNKYGYTPLHLVIINGYLSILEVFISTSPNSLQCLTKDGETVFHLALRFNRYRLIVCLTQFCDNSSNLLHQQDPDGNNLLHLAVSAGNAQLVKYILNSTTVDINSRNDEGQTAFDILKQAERGKNKEELKNMLKKPNDDRKRKLSFLLPELEQNNLEEAHRFEVTSPEEKITTLLGSEKAQGLAVTNLEESEKLEESSPDEIITALLQSRSRRKLRKMPNPRTDDKFEVPQPIMDIGTNQGADALNQAELGSSEVAQLNEYKYLSQIRRKEQRQLHQSQPNRQYLSHREALQNARNTIILVAILIATVTFTVGLNPPGGVNEKGGGAVAGRKMAFKIFVICNSIALFTSLCIVIVVVSIIPFERKKLMRLMVITHKVMWIAVAFMATAFVAATWVLIPNDENSRWIIEVLLAIGGGSMATIFVYLGVLLVRHWLRKQKWKKQKFNKDDKEGGIQSESSNSDVDSSVSIGYHTY